MGVYGFKCKECEKLAEIEMPMHDVGAVFPTCEQCGAAMVRNYHTVPAHYNAEGFTQSTDPLYL